MHRYEVIADVAPELVDRYLAYMRDRHLPEIRATKCFTRVSVDRASATRFRARYEAATRADIDRYLNEHSPKLRADFAALFPTGITLTRELWEEVLSLL